MELGVIVRGRWRSLCAQTGRVEGWRRRPTLAVLRHGALWPAPLTSLLNVVPGPRLYPQPKQFLSSPPEHRCVNVNAPVIDLLSSSSSDASLDANVKTARGGSSPQYAAFSHVAVQTEGEDSSPHGTACRLRHVGVQTDDDEKHIQTDNDEKHTPHGTACRRRHVGVQTDDDEKHTAPAPGAAFDGGAGDTRPAVGVGEGGAGPAVGGDAGRTGGGGECRELLVDAQAVRLLRKYARKHDTDIDIARFDRDDRYKALVFFKINPLVRVERCPKITKLLQDRNNPQATEYFARQLGLCSTVENSSVLQGRDTGGHSGSPHKTQAGVRKKVSFQGSLVSKRSGATVWREYTEQEDIAMVRWLLADKWRVRAVNGNRVWRELEPAFPALSRTHRSWHSLRNRYLRYLLPSLDSPALKLAPSAARQLREGAALGEMKARRSKQQYSPAPAPPRGAFSRRPSATVRPLDSSSHVPAAAVVRPRQGGPSLLSPPALRSPSRPTPRSPLPPTLRSSPSRPTLRSSPSRPTLRSPPSRPSLRSLPTRPTLRSPSRPTPRSPPSRPTLRSPPSRPTPRSPLPPTLRSPPSQTTLLSSTPRSPVLPAPSPRWRLTHPYSRSLRPRTSGTPPAAAGDSTQAVQPRAARAQKRRLYNPVHTYNNYTTMTYHSNSLLPVQEISSNEIPQFGGPSYIPGQAL